MKYIVTSCKSPSVLHTETALLNGLVVSVPQMYTTVWWQWGICSSGVCIW